MPCEKSCHSRQQVFHHCVVPVGLFSQAAFALLHLHIIQLRVQSDSISSLPPCTQNYPADDQVLRHPPRPPYWRHLRPQRPSVLRPGRLPHQWPLLPRHLRQRRPGRKPEHRRLPVRRERVWRQGRCHCPWQLQVQPSSRCVHVQCVCVCVALVMVPSNLKCNPPPCVCTQCVCVRDLCHYSSLLVRTGSVRVRDLGSSHFFSFTPESLCRYFRSVVRKYLCACG